MPLSVFEGLRRPFYAQPVAIPLPATLRLWRGARFVRWGSHAHRAHRHPSHAPRGDLEARPVRRAAIAAGRAFKAITAPRGAQAILLASAVSTQQNRSETTPSRDARVSAVLSSLIAAAGRFNPDISGTSLASCLLSPKGAYTPTEGSRDYTKCASGDRVDIARDTAGPAPAFTHTLLHSSAKAATSAAIVYTFCACSPLSRVLLVHRPPSALRRPDRLPAVLGGRTPTRRRRSHVHPVPGWPSLSHRLIFMQRLCGALLPPIRQFPARSVHGLRCHSGHCVRFERHSRRSQLDSRLLATLDCDGRDAPLQGGRELESLQRRCRCRSRRRWLLRSRLSRAAVRAMRRRNILSVL